MALYPTEQERAQMEREETAKQKQIESDHVDFVLKKMTGGLFTRAQAESLWQDHLELRQRIAALENRGPMMI